ncbi:MAG: hypothetical protein OXD50_09355 [Chloroflexi bacterium]|nr:hypothetical protein [Chloroflexota bacterium]
MKVLVSDSSILIEFSKREILHTMFELEYQFAVPDLLFHEELIDLGSYSRQDLLGFGLRVEALSTDGVATAVAYQAERAALSLVDAFALTLAGIHRWPILTEDRTMRRFAESKSISHLDALWIVDRMLVAGVLPGTQALVALDAMLNDPRCPLPKPELARRIGHLRD